MTHTRWANKDKGLETPNSQGNKPSEYDHDINYWGRPTNDATRQMRNGAPHGTNNAQRLPTTGNRATQKDNGMGTARS